MKNRSIQLLVLVMITAMTGSNPATAMTWTVEANGSGDFLTISDAVAAATDGDEIVVGPGMYDEQIDTSKSLTVRGASMPSSVVVTETGPLPIFWLAGTESFVIEGMTFRGATYNDAGGVVHAREGSAVEIRDCVFEDNSSDFDAAAVHVRHAASSLLVEGCTFEGNYAAHNAPAVNAIMGASLILRACRFINNRADVFSGAVASNDSSMDVSDCLFAGNRGGVASAIRYYNSSGQVTGCTFYNNESGPGSATLAADATSTVVRCLFSDEAAGYAIMGHAVRSCNLYWNNALGPLASGGLEPDEVIGNPLFCDAPGGDFGIAESSPAAPAYSPCGDLIGGFAPRCGNAVPALTASWGSMKARYAGPQDVQQ